MEAIQLIWVSCPLNMYKNIYRASVSRLSAALHCPISAKARNSLFAMNASVFKKPMKKKVEELSRSHSEASVVSWHARPQEGKRLSAAI